MKRVLIGLLLLCMTDAVWAGHPPRFRRLPLYLPSDGVAVSVDPNRDNAVMLIDFSVTNVLGEPVHLDVSSAGNDLFVGLEKDNESAYIAEANGTNAHRSYASNDFSTNHTMLVMSNLTAGTFTIFVKLDATNAQYRIMQMSNNQGGASPGLLFWEANGTSQMAASLFTNGVVAWTIRSTSKILANTAGEWHHWGLRHSGTNAGMTFDGAVIALDLVNSTAPSRWIADTFQSVTPPNYIAWGAALAGGSIFFPLNGDLYRPAVYSVNINIADMLLTSTNTHPVVGIEVLPF